uniref:Aspartyl proteinase n=1 Tax=Ganoderma boninense TaxID=34458 RepID=A0A5K1K1F4_9APHY|nr:Aspartyl proteinase [Ganoderma boninense]
MLPPLDIARIITVKNTSFISNLTTVGIAALVGYDYLLTVPRECRLLWKRRRVNAATILFFVNRYTALLYYVVLAYYRCLSLTVPRSWFLSALTFFWSALAFPLDYYGDFHHTSFIEDPVLRCLPAATTPTTLSLIGQYGTIFIRGGQIFADVLVIGITWRATYHAFSEGSKCFLARVTFEHELPLACPVHAHFIRDQGLGAVECLSLSLIVSSSLILLPSSITAILVSRFILDLHETHRSLSEPSGLTGVQVLGSDIGRLGSRELVSFEEELEEWSVEPNKAWLDTQSGTF